MFLRELTCGAMCLYKILEVCSTLNFDQGPHELCTHKRWQCLCVGWQHRWVLSFGSWQGRGGQARAHDANARNHCEEVGCPRLRRISWKRKDCHRVRRISRSFATERQHWWLWPSFRRDGSSFGFGFVRRHGERHFRRSRPNATSHGQHAGLVGRHLEDSAWITLQQQPFASGHQHRQEGAKSWKRDAVTTTPQNDYT